MDYEDALAKIEELLDTLPEFKYVSGNGPTLYVWATKDLPLLLKQHTRIRSAKIEYMTNGTYSITGMYIVYNGNSCVWVNGDVRLFFDLEDNFTSYLKRCMCPVVKLGWK